MSCMDVMSGMLQPLCDCEGSWPMRVAEQRDGVTKVWPTGAALDFLFKPLSVESILLQSNNGSKGMGDKGSGT